MFNRCVSRLLLEIECGMDTEDGSRLSMYIQYLCGSLIKNQNQDTRGGEGIYILPQANHTIPIPGKIKDFASLKSQSPNPICNYVNKQTNQKKGKPSQLPTEYTSTITIRVPIHSRVFFGGEKTMLPVYIYIKYIWTSQVNRNFKLFFSYFSQCKTKYKHLSR